MGASLDEHGAPAGVERLRHQFGLVPLANRADREQDRGAFGQEFRPAMAELAAGRVELRHARWRAAVGGHTLQRRPGRWRKDNGAVAAPTSSKPDARITNDDWRPTGDRYFLQLAVGEEGNPLAIGREERANRVGGARKGYRVHRVETPERQLRGAAARGKVGHETAVRGNGKRGEIRGGEALAVRQRHGELDLGRRRAGRRAHQARHDCRAEPRPKNEDRRGSDP